MAIIRGLNVSKALIDIDDKKASLANLGLRIDDLDLLRNLVRDADLNIFDFHQIAGLVDNQLRLFSSQQVCANTADSDVENMNEVDSKQRYNLAVDDRLIAGAIKYNYVDFVTPNLAPIVVTQINGTTISGSNLDTVEYNGKTYTLSAGDKIRITDTGSSVTSGDYEINSVSSSQIVLTSSASSGAVTDFTNIVVSFIIEWPVRSADISTSRVSSWSPIGPENAPDSYITYGGELVVDGEYLALTKLGVTSQPVEKQFRAEVPTHTIKLNINGSDVQLPVIKGIPLEFISSGANYAYIRLGRSANTPAITDNEGVIPATFKVSNLSIPSATPLVYDRNVSSTTTQTVFSYGLNTTNKYKAEVYYPPNNIGFLSVYRFGVKDFPNTKMENLKELELLYNQFKYIPNLKSLTPSLEKLKISYNPLHSAVNYLEDLDLGHLDGVYQVTEEFVDNDLRQIVSQKQLDNLPISIKEVEAINAFRGSINLNTEHLPNCVKFQIYATSSSQANRITWPFESPRGADPGTAIEFNPSTTDVYEVTNNVARFKLSNHQLSTGDVVKYDFHAYPLDTDDDPTVGVGVDNMGQALGGLTGGELYDVAKISDNEIELRDRSSGVAPTSSAYTALKGELHSFVKWNTTDNDIFIDTNKAPGFEEMKLSYASYQFLSRHICNSPALEIIDFDSTPIKSIGRTPYVTRGGVEGDANRLKSNSDRKIYFKSKVLTSIKLRYYRANLNLDFSDNPLLKSLWLENCRPDRFWGDSQRTINASMLNNCPALTTIKFKYLYQSLTGSERVRANIDSILRNKPNLTLYDEYYNAGVHINLDDNTLSGNGGSLQTFSSYAHSGGRGFGGFEYNSDYFAIDGSNNRTGLCFEACKGSMTNLKVRFQYHKHVRLVNDDDLSNVIKVPISDMSNLDQLWIYECNQWGKVPSLSNLSKLNRIWLYNGKSQRAPAIQSFGENNIFSIRVLPNNSQYGNGTTLSAINQYGYFLPKEYEDMGWSSTEKDSDLVDFGSDVQHGSTPAVGDHFKYNYLDVDNIIPGMYYMIQDVGSMTTAQWQNLGWAANTPYADPYNKLRGRQSSVFTHGYEFCTGSQPKRGDFFRCPPSKTGLNRAILGSLTNGAEYRILRSGFTGSGSYQYDFRNQGASNNNVGTVFTADTSNDATINSNTNSTYGTFRVAERTTYSDLGDGKISRVSTSTFVQGVQFLGFRGSLGDLQNMSQLQDLRVYNNSFSGQFPNPIAPALKDLYAQNNYFSGNVPDMSDCPILEELKLNNNDITGYVSQSLRFNTKATLVDLSENRLPASVAGDLINDLWFMATPNTPRKGITVRLNGQKGFDPGTNEDYLDNNGFATRLSVQALIDIPGSGDDDNLDVNGLPLHPYRRYLSLIGAFQWDIEIDET